MLLKETKQNKIDQKVIKTAETTRLYPPSLTQKINTFLLISISFHQHSVIIDINKPCLVIIFDSYFYLISLFY